LSFALAVLVALATLWLASQAVLGRRPRVAQHAAFLAILGACLSVRAWSGEPQPPPDPAPVLLDGLRAVAAALDRDFEKTYAPDEAKLDAALAALPPPGYRRLGRVLKMRAVVSGGAEGPRTAGSAADLPGTIYVEISNDRTAAWITARALNGILKLPSGKPALIEAHGGTHSLPGRDPLVPAYPGMRGLTDRKR
jgi:hypothetical protein